MGHNGTDTLIITSAINPVIEAQGVRITDPELRLFQLCCSVLSWLQTNSIKKVILCDNTSPKCNFQPMKQMAERWGKKMEVLTFAGDSHGIKKKGKGYGEGEILRHVFENSKLIGECDGFYKITGRVFVQNFDAVHGHHLRLARVFDNPLPRFRRLAKRIMLGLSAKSRHQNGMVRTVFYKCDSTFFRRMLLDRHRLVCDKQRFYLEHAYFLPLIKSGFSTFGITPILVGFSSSSGALYHGLDYPASIKREAESLTRSLLE